MLKALLLRRLSRQAPPSDAFAVGRPSSLVITSSSTKYAAPLRAGHEDGQSSTRIVVAVFIRAQNIGFGKLRLDNLACVNPPNRSEGTRTRVSIGDLLIVITGAGVTSPALVDCDFGEAYVSQHVALIKPISVELSRWLLLCLIADAACRTTLLAAAYGSGKPGLNLDTIRRLTIPIPPQAEMHRILSRLDDLIAVVRQTRGHAFNEQTDS